MKANYQPVMIKTLLESSGYKASRQKIIEKLKEANNYEKKDYALIAYDTQREGLGKEGRNLVLKDEQTKEYSLDVEELTKAQKEELISICETMIEKFENQNVSNDIRYFIALGPWTNWKHTIDNPPFRWGVNPSSASNVGVFNALQENDIVFFYANQDPPTPFSKRGLFGVGRVTRKYDEANEQYWPDEKTSNKVIYKHRFEINPIKIVKTDSEILPWIDGLPFTKGLNRIANPEILEKLLQSTKTHWNIDLQNVSENYMLLRHNAQGSKWDDDLGKIYHTGKIPNYTKLAPGVKTIWYYRENGQYRFWGHGDISKIEENNGEFFVKFNNFEFFNSDKTAKIGTDSIKQKIVNLPGFNQQISMLPITKEIYDEIINGKAPLQYSENTKLTLPKQNLNEVKKEIQKQLLIPGDVIDQIINSLYSGKHIILTGPVGTGKTHLAQLIPKMVWKNVGGYYPQIVTATSEWTTQDVIGGIFPKVDGNEIKYIIQKGCVSDTVSKNWQDGTGRSERRQKFEKNGIEYNGVWLIIDEFNRANIDRAFGPLFTALEYKKLQIPTTNPNKTFEELTIPEDYRIIGTLNTFDKHFLFRLSDALKRRFSFIEILPPTYDKILEEIRFVADKALEGYDDLRQDLNIQTFEDLQSNKELYHILTNLYEIMAFIRMSKNLGTAVLIAMFRFSLINYVRTKNADHSIDSAILTHLLPHLESLQYWQIDSIMNFVGGRIHELFRKFDVNKRPDVDRYEEELRNLVKYLKISGTNKSAGTWINKFKTGELNKISSPVSELDPWSNKQRPNLQKFRTALESLKQEKGYFEESEGLE